MASNHHMQEYQHGRKRRLVTSMNVPIERADDVRRLLERLNIQNEEKNEEKKDEKNGETFEVTSVCNHRQNVHTNMYEWEVRFKGFSQSPEWTSDEDSDCEKLIQEYLKEKAPYIRTIYGLCRVSSKSQTGLGHVSLDAQEECIRKTASTLTNPGNFRIKMYKITSSAYKGVPSQLQDIAENARKGDIIITYRVDRLSRNIVLFLSVLEEIHNKGVLIYAQDEDIWYHNRRLDFIQFILDANKEAAIISKRVKVSVEHRRKRGDYIGSAPYGYRLTRGLTRDTTSKVIKEYNPDEQETIKYIKGCLTGTGWHKIADKLNKDGNYKRGKPWTAQMVRYVFDYN